MTLERFTFERLQTALLFLAIATAACLMPAQHDTWWLLRAGHDMWSAGHLLLTDTFLPYRLPARIWPNHEWLSELLFYGVYALGGLPLLTLASALVVTLRGRSSDRDAGADPREVPVDRRSWSPRRARHGAWRAQVLSLLLVALTMAAAAPAADTAGSRSSSFWANLHGAVLLGLLLLGAALAAAARLKDRGRRAEAAARRGAVRAWRHR